MTGQWTNIKPEFNEPCVLVTARKTKHCKWVYSVFQINWVDCGGRDELYLFTDDGDEWGDITELAADLYMILPKHEQ